MKILSVKAQNFGSYKELSFDFSSQGLTLIQGANGSGKSTLCDLIPWTLFGRTAKGGAVSEVLTWPGDQITTATLTMADGFTYTRRRGSKSGDNDLYWRTRLDDVQNGVSHRGKDLNDTQRLINLQLGMDYDLYLASAYYHEFSQTAQFFTTTAKNRRTICEQLVDLSLPKSLQTKASEEIKIKAKTQSEYIIKISSLASNLTLLQRLQASESTKASAWDYTQGVQKEKALKAYQAFEAGRKRIIMNKCHTCSTVLAAPKEVYDGSANPHYAAIERLEQEQNPYTGSLKDYGVEITATETARRDTANASNGLRNEIEELELLQQVIQDFRSVSISNTISFVEEKTNSFLTDFFDAEIRVSFTVAEADKLEVEIQKDGNQATYTQLSKGQRCILKLCFGLAVMQTVSNHHGITPNALFLDEALDGLSSEMKEKAFRLFETISQGTESVFVVEHSEHLKPMFSNSYTVRLTNEGSVIAKT